MNKSANRDIFFSLASQGLPAAAALISLPILVRAYGLERFGLLTFFWLILNYVSFLDLGIARTLTKTLASSDSQSLEQRSSLLKSSFVFLSSAGLLGFLLIWSLKDLILERYLKLSPEMASEALSSLNALSFILPALLLFSFFKSTLEGLKQFSKANSLQLISGLISYVVPLLCLLASQRLDLALQALAVARWLLVIWAASALIRHLGTRWLSHSLGVADFHRLFKQGLWFSLLTILNPLLIYLDRFLVSSSISMSELAYYTAPFEIVTRFWLVPMAVTRILFPTFSTHGGNWTPETRHSFRLGLFWITCLLLPPTLILFVWGQQILSLWLGPSFGEQSFTILRILLVGVFVNSLNWVPFTMIQASRKIHWTVYIPLAELIFFLLAFFPLVKEFGVRGAALAWSGRLVIDACIWFVLTGCLRSKDRD